MPAKNGADGLMRVTCTVREILAHAPLEVPPECCPPFPPPVKPRGPGAGSPGHGLLFSLTGLHTIGWDTSATHLDSVYNLSSLRSRARGPEKMPIFQFLSDRSTDVDVVLRMRVCKPRLCSFFLFLFLKFIYLYAFHLYFLTVLQIRHRTGLPICAVARGTRQCSLTKAPRSIHGRCGIIKVRMRHR